MWETIERMTDDRLWVYTAIAGSIFSALFIAYMRDTKIALWLFGKWDWLLDSINPNIARKIEDLDARLSKLESKKK